ncbi:MAG TPA: hypothetical protein VGD61_17565 [Pyrinomonadaceae bacterium]
MPSDKISANDSATERLRSLLAQITYLTTQGELQWDRQLQSAHRYSRWKNNLLILGPDVPLEDSKTPRYLFITPFDSPDCIEINSDNEELGPAVLSLVRAVEASTANKPPTDPFAVSDELLSRLTE